METELSALTEENNAKFVDLSQTIDVLNNEKNKLHEIMHEQIITSADFTNSADGSIPNQQNVAYLLNELESNAVAFADALEENNQLSKLVEELTSKNKILSNRLREHGLDDATVPTKSVHDVAMVIRKTQKKYQGIYKYRFEDTAVILQRLIQDLTPRVAITLFPALPAYILFMCIR